MIAEYSYRAHKPQPADEPPARQPSTSTSFGTPKTAPPDGPAAPPTHTGEEPHIAAFSVRQPDTRTPGRLLLRDRYRRGYDRRSARDPLSGRRRRPGRQGRELRGPPRRRGPGRAGRRVRRGRRGRADLPRRQRLRR